jgi:hypothetical protein
VLESGKFEEEELSKAVKKTITGTETEVIDSRKLEVV